MGLAALRLTVVLVSFGPWLTLCCSSEQSCVYSEWRKGKWRPRLTGVWLRKVREVSSWGRGSCRLLSLPPLALELTAFRLCRLEGGSNHGRKDGVGGGCRELFLLTGAFADKVWSHCCWRERPRAGAGLLGVGAERAVGRGHSCLCLLRTKAVRTRILGHLVVVMVSHVQSPAVKGQQAMIGSLQVGLLKTHQELGSREDTEPWPFFFLSNLVFGWPSGDHPVCES